MKIGNIERIIWTTDLPRRKLVMAGQTIAERFCQTTNSTARHMLQDTAAMFGAQCVVSEQLEEKLTSAEAKHIMLSIERAVCPKSDPAVDPWMFRIQNKR
jgi:hypothetical protein